MELYQSTIGEMACKVAISALEEIQKYRALGTVKELRKAMDKQRATKPNIWGDARAEIRRFESYETVHAADKT